MTIFAAANSTFEAVATNAPTGLVGTIAVQILDGQGGVTTARSTAGIVETPAGSGTYVATRTTSGERGAYVVFWDGGVVSPETTASEDLIVGSAIGDGPQFAQVDELAARVGGTLSDSDAAMAETLLQAATSVIAEAAGKDDAWAAALDPVPNVLRFLCIEVARRVLANPEGLRSSSEQLGAYQHSRSFQDAASAGLLLTKTEELLVRRTVHGRTSASSRPGSIATEAYPDCTGS